MEFSNLPDPLSAKDRNSFAFSTVSKRLPQILAVAVDSCHRKITTLQQQHQEAGRQDGLKVVSRLSRLRNRVMTDKELEPFEDDFVDIECWKLLLNQNTTQQNKPTWFQSNWLLVECYMYRYIQHCLLQSKFCRNVDLFAQVKEESMMKSRDRLSNLAANFLHLDDVTSVKKRFVTFFKMSLWANRADLSLSAASSGSLSKISEESLDENLLVDDTEIIWSHLNNLRDSGTKVKLGVILDNFGAEFFSDLILCDFLLSQGFAHSIHLFPKCFPWFVSDVTTRDFAKMLEMLDESGCKDLKDCGMRWEQLMKTGNLVFEQDPSRLKFFTTAHPYYVINQSDADLAHHLSSFDLLIFKGDLNYRKLVADLNWAPEVPFKDALLGFKPAPFCTLRTLKADVVVGLKPGQAQTVQQQDDDWMVTGKYAVIQSLI